MSEATPANPKQLLADLIDAYASAKMTGNETLIKLSVTQLQAFLETHEVVDSSPTEQIGEE
jgi:hypothetical protein